MGGALAALLVVAAMAGLILLLARAWTPSPVTGRREVRLPGRRRAEVEAALAGARWSAAHDERDGETRVLLRRSCTGPDGWPIVLEERVFDTVPGDDPAWEARFTEAMAAARFRCEYLNREESAD
jgi:hypothetical protein